MKKKSLKWWNWSGYQFVGTNHSKIEPLNLHEWTKLVQRSFLEEAPFVELKSHPTDVKYMFIGEDETLPVIISSKLSKEKEDALIAVLKKHKRWLGGLDSSWLARNQPKLYAQH